MRNFYWSMIHAEPITLVHTYISLIPLSYLSHTLLFFHNMCMRDFYWSDIAQILIVRSWVNGDEYNVICWLLIKIYKICIKFPISSIIKNLNCLGICEQYECLFCSFFLISRKRCKCKRLTHIYAFYFILTLILPLSFKCMC